SDPLFAHHESLLTGRTWNSDNGSKARRGCAGCSSASPLPAPPTSSQPAGPPTSKAPSSNGSGPPTGPANEPAAGGLAQGRPGTFRMPRAAMGAEEVDRRLRLRGDLSQKFVDARLDGRDL